MINWDSDFLSDLPPGSVIGPSDKSSFIRSLCPLLSDQTLWDVLSVLSVRVGLSVLYIIGP
jgi:hypothetical protein